MKHLTLRQGANDKLTVLCIGAHSDDIEIGCGGTVLWLSSQFSNCEFHWVVFSAVGVREAEARRAAALFVNPDKLKSIVLHNCPDGFLPSVGADVKNLFEDLKQRVSPDLILTHTRADAHQDHRLINELTWNTFRDHLILEYEIPKYDGDLGHPSVFVPLEGEFYQSKVRHLLDVFESQRGKRWFRDDTFLGLMRLRGMECNAPSGYAEAFYCRKLVL